MDVQAIYHRAQGAAEFLEPGDPGYETTTADVPALIGAHDELREALHELYETAHDLLNAPDPDGRMAAGTPRLNAALGRAFEALHEK